MSARIWPDRTPSTSPFGPSATSSTSGEFGSIVMIRSPAARATAAGESAVFAPSPASSWTAAWLRLLTTTAWPAFRRFLTMGRPMIPSPMNPIGPCMTSVSSQSLAGDLEAGLPRPRRGVERDDYRSGASRVKGRSPARGRRYRRRAIQANVGAVRLRLDRVVPWRPDRLAIDPWTVLRLARYRRRDEAPAAVWEATRAMAARAGELAEPDRAAPAAPRRRGRLGPGVPRPGPVVLRSRGRAPSRGRAAGGRVRPDARAGARGRGDRPRRAAGPPRGLPPRPRGLGGDRGGGAGAPAGPDRRAPASARVTPARPRPPRLAAHRAARPRDALRGRRRARAALRARRPHPLQVDQRPLRAPRR